MNKKKLDKSNIQDILGLTSMQEGMLFHYLSNPESKQYLEQLCLTICGKTDESIIKKAWNHVIQNNEMLRTIFKWDKLDKPLQIILKQHEISYAQYDLSKINSADRIIQVMEIKDRESNKKIDISENPLRMTIIKLDSMRFELIITYHHILYDGWSNGILLKEFVQACNYLSYNKTPTVIRKTNFKEFIKHCQKQNKNIQEAFWRKHFYDYEFKSTIGSKFINSENCTVNRKISYRFDEKISDGIYELCKKEKTTTAAVLYTAWGILLQKYNNTNDIVFGTTVSGRNADITGIEDMVGLFINTLPLRVNSFDDESIQSLLKKADCILKERDEYQNTPLLDIKSYSGINSKEELFDTLVVIENYPLDKALLSGDNSISIEEYSMTEMTNYKLTLTITDFEGMELQFKYDTSVFDDAEINRMVKHFENIIVNIIENPVCSISQIDILTEEERRQILIDFNNTKADYPKDKTIHQLFEEQVERTPDSIAVVYEDKQLSYRELNERANQLARVLRDKGVGSDSIVGIMAERSLDMIVGIMGILKAGGAYLPIDPDNNDDRIKYMLQDSQCDILLSNNINVKKLELDIDIITLADIKQYSKKFNNQENINKPYDLAYVMYTSGSTGKPKGVLIEHRSVVRLVKNTNYIDFSKCSRILQTGAIVFDASTFEIWGSLLNGLRLHLTNKEVILDDTKLKKELIRNNIDTIWLTSSLFSQLTAEDASIFMSCRNLLAGGDILSVKHVNTVRKVCKGINIINGYGPTENTTFSVCCNIDKDYTDNIPIGKPISNSSAYILGKNNMLQPIGIAGELCVAGEGLARGYLNRPELTAEKFVDNPFKSGTRMYKTGDLARWLPDGNIEFLGRIDNQVKIRGFRIELGEIESKLLGYSEVKEAVVVAKNDNSGSRYLCAYVVGDKEITVSELREYLSKTLPDYMIPSYFIQLEKLPLTVNGKIDRKALPEPDGNISTGAEYEAPRNAIEENLAELWKEILGVSKIGINDNFFELGGHSLKATSLAAKIHKLLNIEIPLRIIFGNPTIKGISEYIKGCQENIYLQIQPVEAKEYYEMSSAQKRIYTLQQFDKASTGYNMPGLLKLEGDLDKERLREAFVRLIQRYEALRTSFEMLEEGIVQRIHEKEDFEIEEYEAKEQEEIDNIIKSFIRAFDLSKAPLLRVGLIKVQPKLNILIYDMHHIISDGVSMGILIKEFKKAYAGEELTPLRIQYKDFAAWQNELFRSKKLKVQEEYWLSQFEGEIPVLNLPTDYQRPTIQSFEGDRISFEAGSELTEKLRKIAKETGSTMYMVLLSTFNILLSKYSGQEDIIVGSPIAGRPHADLESIMGMFVNTLAMRNYPSGEKTYREFLREVKENALKAYENQDYQFEELVDKLNITRDMSRNPLFDVMFVLQNTEMEALTLEGLTIKLCQSENQISKFDMTLTAVENKDSISLSIAYSTRLFNKATVERMYRHLEGIMLKVTNNPDMKLCDIEAMTEEEKKQILIDFNNTKSEYPSDKTINQLFEGQVEQTPDNIAVVYEDKQLTYRELNEKSNQLARILRAKGVGANSIVGIMTDRSLEMIVGIMGILKAGGAYLPIDPEYPRERIEYVLEDSKANILLTQSWLNKEAARKKETINLDDENIYEGKSDNLEKASKPSDLAYVIYTSGTSGKPKGVMLQNNNLVNYVTWFINKANITSSDKTMLLSSFAFDLGYTALYTSILMGAELHIIKKETYTNLEKLISYINDKGITYMKLTPSLYSTICNSEGFISGKGLSPTRIVVLGGEAINTIDVENTFKVNKSIQIMNHYGPTETTVGTAACMIDLNSLNAFLNKPVIGKPISNNNIYIVDKYQKLTPIGIAGELCVAGEGLAREYLNRPKLTAEKFVDNPFKPGTRMYRTGDLARWLPDGNIEFLGRIDNQVKIRGFRIELGEIENKLLSHIEIKEAIVTAKEDKSGNKYLCAYIAGEKKIEISELREHLRKDLPDYMIPSYFIQLDKLPLTANGKVDRKALSEPDGNISTGAEYEAPRNAIEEKLVEIWREILGVERIGINDNFFELGGHSLRATSLIAKIHKSLNAEIPLREIFSNPTIKGIAKYLKTNEENIYSQIQPVAAKEYYEMSSAQKRIYTLQQFDIDSTGYNMPRVVQLEGELNEKRLKEAFCKLIERHEALRTGFEMLEEGIVQRIHKNVDFEIEKYEAKEEKDIDEIIKDFVKAFDLSNAPLLRVGLIKVQPEIHILISDMHHIISDGVSTGILINEFSKAYAGEELTPLRIQYKDFAAWQNELFESEKIKAQEEYWLKQFAGEVPVLNLPTDHQRPTIQSFEGDRISFELGNELTEKLRKIAKATGSTMYMVLLSTLNILLSKYSGQEDIVVGSPIAGRPHADLENIMGMFVNTLAMRNYPRGEKTYREFLREVKENALQAYENQDYQFEELVEKLKIKRDMSRNPLFDVMLVLHNTEIRALTLEGLMLKPYQSDNRVSKFDITLLAVEHRDSIDIIIEYSTKLFNKATVERMHKHLKNIMLAAVNNPDVKLSEIEILTEEERYQILSQFNNTKAEYPRNKIIHQLFEEQLERTPDNIAVVYEEKQLTYRELNEKANKLAIALQGKGVLPDSIVGVMVERSPEMIIGIMGILKAGGAYLPIDPEYPQDRIEYMVKDSKTSVIITNYKSFNIEKIDCEIMYFEDELTYDYECKKPEAKANEKNLAYIIYTSGSTGKPKGVMVEHGAIVNTLRWRTAYYALCKKDAVLQIPSFAFDSSVEDIFSTLLTGGKLVLLNQENRLNIQYLKDKIQKENVTHLLMVPSFYTALISDEIEDLQNLRFVTVAGESCTQKLIKQHFTKLKNTRLFNEYGPTENSVCSTICEIKEDTEEVSIGKPILNSKCYIVDKFNNLLPVSVYGELCVSGAGLARGYLNKPELTAEKFVDNPFEPGSRMYHTGDLARWMPDGNIEFIGRIDHQVKIRGFRIELGEIENKLQSCKAVIETAVIETAVIARDDDNGNKYLCAYIVGEEELNTSELRKELSKDLPDYMIPAYFIQLDKLPLTPNGKIDRKALPEPDGNISTGAEYEAPRNAIEEKLAEIWKEILNVEKIGINDNFFELGGHSLRATSLVAKIHKILNSEVPLKEIFANPTIKWISEYIKDCKESIYSSIKPIEEKEYYEMSSAQKRVYTLQQLEFNSTSYNMPGAMELEGELDTKRLKEAFNKLIQRHEALRTSFEATEEGLLQKVHKQVEFEIEEYEVKEEKAIEEIIKGFIRVFDLKKAPLLRVGLVKIHSNKHILMYDMHHIISDGTSMGILIEEFEKAYAGEELTPLRIQYKDFSAWQNELFKSEKIKAQEEYWLKQFEGEIPVLNLPTDYQRPAVQSFEGDTIKFEIGNELTNKLRQITKAAGSTMYMVLLSTLNILLSKYSGQEDVIIGSPIAGRPHADLENIIGMFVNTLAMRNYPIGEKTFKEFLREVKENALEAYENQDYQFEELVEKLNIARDFSRNPVFDVMFVLQNMDIGETALEGINIRPYKSENKVSKFDITMTAEELENSISINIQYCTKLFNRETIERMYKHLENIIQVVTANIDAKLSEIDILTKAERQQILIDFNSTKADYPKDKTIHSLFEEQVQRTPDNIAVVFEDKQLTYRELNDRANQLARVLRDKGVVPDSIVGIMAERSLDMIVGIMSILKAGGAYLPIDPEYPKDRIQYMLKDSGANILLTQRNLKENIAYNGEIIALDEEEIYDKDKNNLDIKVRSNNLAYIIYTSGTTGKPKGAMIEHRNVVSLLFNDGELFDFTEKDVWTMFHSYCFDFSVWEMYGALLYGGKLVVIPKLIARDTAEYLKILEKQKVTVLNQTPSAFYRLIEEDEKAGKAELCIRYVIFGGEALKPGAVKGFYKKYPKTKLINMYGITETTVHVTYREITKEDINLNISNIGKAIPTLTTYIMDKNTKLVPIGIPGELCVGGAGVGRGYLKRPELTEEKFINNPFKSGERLYRSGDLVRLLLDGNMEYLGRIDHQVKIRGHRIELGEIENKLLNYVGIKEAIVIVRKDDDENNYICAYIVAEKEQIQGKNITVSELREHLSKALPDYMIPSYFIQLEKLPITSNGKVDRKALPEPDGNIFTGAEYEAPRNSTEEKLVSIWREILGVEKIGINDSFFELGGHSLKATSLVAKIHKILNTEVPLKEIFANPTIKEISEYIKDCKESIYSSIEPIEEKEYYEMSSAQKRIYTLQQLELESTSYNIPGVMELEGDLDIVRLKEAFNKLIQRHEALRTSFEAEKEGLLQKVYKQVEFEIEEYEVKEEKEIEGVVKGFIRVFDLSKAPLLRVGLIKIHSNKYILMFDMHHIISDGTSMGIFVEEFSKIYAGEELTPLRIQYKDFSEWQNELFKSEKIKAQEGYWLKHYEGEIPALNLPTDYQRPSMQSFEGDTIKFDIDKELTNKLKQITKATGSTMYMVLLSTFNILLSKYSGQEDIIVGSPIAGRPHADLENIIGMFVNTLAMRNYPSGEKTFSEFLKEVKENALEAYENQDYQFEELVEKLDIKRDISRNPLFDTMLILQNMDTKSIELEKLKTTFYNFKDKISKFDITLSAVEIDEGIHFILQYCTKLFKAETIERLIGHYVNILQGIASNPDLKLKEINMVSEEEKQHILSDFNETKEQYANNKTIHELFEEQAKKTSDNIAVVCGDRKLTYRELNERANQLAWLLREKGAEADTIVGIMIERSLELIIGVFAILKAGGAILPIDPKLPDVRKQYMLKDSNAKILIVNAEANDNCIKKFEGHTISLSAIELKQSKTTNLKDISSCEKLLYLIYTSGTTGNPKGVMLEHRTLINLISFQNKYTDINFENNKVTQFAAMSFDVCYQEIFSTLLNGGELHIVSNNDKNDINLFLEFIEEREIDIVFLPTAYLKYLSSYREYLDKLSYKVKHIIAAGEQLIITDELKKKLRDNKIYLHNHYGPSETHVVSTYTIDPEGEIETIPSIGKPISNNKFYILSRDEELQPIGVPGELCIAGECIGRGYINMPELTKKKFIENPFNKGERMYKTGDLVRWLSDGNVEYLGRIDKQVKIRGFRIELGEIESKLQKHEQIKEAVVIVKEAENGEKYLCSYIVPNREMTVGELRNYLSKELPEYMIPSYFVMLENFPLTPNGKIDKRALPEPEGNINTGIEYEAPRNITEEKLVKIWEEILKIEKVGINDNFFELGGHSLKATSLISSIHKELSVKIPLREIFNAPTIKKMSKYIMSSTESIYSPIQLLDKREFYEISYSQKRLWILYQLEPNSIAYNIPSNFTLHEELDEAAFNKAFKKLIERHESLRTSFNVIEGEPMQLISNNIDFNISKFDISSIEAAQQLQKRQEIISMDLNKPFDLQTAPLYRVLLVKYKNDEYEIMICMHHIISDGWSLDVLKREFLLLYNSYKNSLSVELEPLAIQYKDFASWQNNLLKDETRMQKAKEFWTRSMSGDNTILSLPISNNADLNANGSNVYRCIISSTVRDKLKQLAKEHTASVYSMLLGILNIYLSDLTGQEDIIIASAGSGRQHYDIKGVIGFFINTMFIRNKININDTFENILKNINENIINVLEYQSYPLELLLDELEISYPKVSVFFNMLNFGDQESELIEDFEPYHIEQSQEAKFDLVFYVKEYANAIEILVNYKSNLFEKDVIENIAKQYIKMMEYVADNYIATMKDYKNRKAKRKLSFK